MRDYKEWKPHHDLRNHSKITDDVTGTYNHKNQNLKVTYVINRLWCIENFISNHIFLYKHGMHIYKEHYEYYNEPPQIWQSLSVLYSDVFPMSWRVERTPQSFSPKPDKFMKCLIKLY